MLTAILTIMARRNFMTIGIISGILAAPVIHAQTSAKSPESGKRYPRLAIRNAIIVDGNGTPASGPKDIVIEGNTIADIVPLDPVALQRGGAKRPAGEVEIDA